MKIKITIAVLSLLLLASCGGEVTRTVKIGGRYQLKLPTDLTETKGLNDDASLEYQNAFKELYVVAIDESKADCSGCWTKMNFMIFTPTIWAAM